MATPFTGRCKLHLGRVKSHK